MENYPNESKSAEQFLKMDFKVNFLYIKKCNTFQLIN